MEMDRSTCIREARRQLVEQRDVIIKSLAHDYSRGQTEAHLDVITKVQAAIEIIDKVRMEGEG